MRIETVQDGNAVHVRGADFTITFDVEGIELPPVDPSFAVWMLLPLAMFRGEDLEFSQPIDPTVLANAQRMTEIWPILRPEHFKPIGVSASAGWQPFRGHRDGSIHLYSGGINSTFTMVEEGRLERQGTALTVLGMDYHLPEVARFDALVRKTAPLLELLNYRRVIVRTNYREVVRKPISLFHAFVFASCQFLLKPLFQRSIMSADCTPEHDMLSFDSSNHVTNKYFAGSDFRMETVGAAYTRTDKVAVLAKRPDVLPTLAFCTQKHSKPENCGQCSKCIRTKAMFIAVGSGVPPIFRDMSFSGRHIARINTGAHRHYAFFAELIQVARREGNIDKLLGLERRLVPRSLLTGRAVATWNRFALWLRSH